MDKIRQSLKKFLSAVFGIGDGSQGDRTGRNVKEGVKENEELFLDTYEERMEYFERVRRKNPGIHINPHMNSPLFVRLGLPSGTMWEVAHPKAQRYPKDDTMLPTILQVKELLSQCTLKVDTDSVVLTAKNGHQLVLDADIFLGSDIGRGCAMWLRDPVADDPDWGNTVEISADRIVFRSEAKSERLYAYRVKIRQSDIL